jgi:hypothetical protein
MTDQELIELRERNAARVQQKIKEMGEKWLLHPNNGATKQKYRKILRTSRKAQLNAG